MSAKTTTPGNDTAMTGSPTARTTVFHNVRKGALVLGVCTALAAGALSVTASADARVPAGDAGPEAYTCKEIQDSYDAHAFTYRHGTTEREQSDAYFYMGTDLDNWRKIGCLGYYGDIFPQNAAGSNPPLFTNASSLQGPPANLHPIKTTRALR